HGVSPLRRQRGDRDPPHLAKDLAKRRVELSAVRGRQEPLDTLAETTAGSSLRRSPQRALGAPGRGEAALLRPKSRWEGREVLQLSARARGVLEVLAYRAR